jgi:hypothetical protein
MADLLGVAPALFVPMVMVALVIGGLIYGRRHLSRVQRDTTDYQAGAIAQRLGLRLERGNPAQNLFVTGRMAEEVQHFDVRLAGQRNEVPVEIVYFRNVEHERGFLEVTIHQTWDVRLTARTTASFGHFEVCLRNPQAHNRVRPYFENPMPELRTGHPVTDRALRITGDNPAIATPLGELLAPLASLQYVHVVGEPGAISFLMSRGDGGRGNEMMGVGYGLYDADRILDVLTRIALTAEGRAPAA